ncbi:uncharacterized protein F5891DRAFT_1183472 [Suillus fuscotomentosus]|uniref:Uncharacterized protein n=1 Tax=Suillus fuscotomentosus TaxID=1912939 RepID=A0AAD4EG56_9AGAM|nr:uncharacterized protein F5891DRAFT_1183472 [Suillus fuscotomentosus]KAG1905527.1 hypothetical protein F5891DRAFT_1183472 [Suillus fuscotomentosus]
MSLTRASTDTLHVDTVYDENGLSLASLCLSICFVGNIQSQLQNPPTFIPLKVSIHIPEAYASQISPIVECISLHVALSGRPSLNSLPEGSFPFFPLAPNFNHLNGWTWAVLADTIQDWLSNNISLTRSDVWLWGCESFWMAFVAAFPGFPRREWPLWDPKIGMEGEFITYWMSDFGSGSERSPDDVRTGVWRKFHDLATMLYPLPLFQEY